MSDPLHQFVISPIWRINVGGVDLSFTNSALSVLAAVVAIGVFLLLGLKDKKLVPDRWQALVEMLHDLVAQLVRSNVGDSGMRYFPFVFSVFIFVLFGNLLGMIPYMFTFTSHIIVTFTLAMAVFLFVTVLGIVLHGRRFFSLFAPKGLPKFLLPLVAPVEMISYLSRPVSLAVRLFANMMAGHTMMKVFAGFSVMLGLGGVAPIAVNVILTGFEIVIALLQAYVFTILTCVYLNDAVHLH
ncbi:MAG: F0F1 ATP synthase subunit A [Holosporaceae bacterium]|jgi:F-type H+-transporting ATPase subunit a|nr:F0F1 ATP synthase subunit A [Holosporaceae bacterium]